MDAGDPARVLTTSQMHLSSNPTHLAILSGAKDLLSADPPLQSPGLTRPCPACHPERALFASRGPLRYSPGLSARFSNPRSPHSPQLTKLGLLVSSATLTSFSATNHRHFDRECRMPHLRRVSSYGGTGAPPTWADTRCRRLGLDSKEDRRVQPHRSLLRDTARETPTGLRFRVAPPETALFSNPRPLMLRR